MRDFWNENPAVAAAYAESLLGHLYFVKVASVRLGVPIAQWMNHDASKWSDEEFGAYANHFYGEDDPAAFDVAWLHHQNLNAHHWQHWVAGYDDGGEHVALQMPFNYVLEMVADWHGAGRAYQGSWDISGWVNENEVFVNPLTAVRVRDVMVDVAGYDLVRKDGVSRFEVGKRWIFADLEYGQIEADGDGDE